MTYQKHSEMMSREYAMAVQEMMAIIPRNSASIRTKVLWVAIVLAVGGFGAYVVGRGVASLLN